MEKAGVINVVPFKQRNGVIVAIVNGVHCYFDRASVIPEPNVPVNVMICSATNPINDRNDMRHGQIRSLTIKAIGEDDVLVEHNGFKWNEEQAWWQTELINSPFEGVEWVSSGRTPVGAQGPGWCYVNREDIAIGMKRITGVPSIEDLAQPTRALLIRREPQPMRQ